MQEDRELLEEIYSGSQAAMEILVNRYYKIVFSYIYRNIGQYHTSYDLTQEVFIKMMKYINSPSKKVENFKGWILKIAINTVKDYFKGNAYKEYKETIEINEEKTDDKNNVVELISHLSESEEVKNAIMQLPEYQRNAIILRFYHDMKISDIANVTDTNESTVKSRLKQGIGKLRDILKGGEKDHEKRLGI